MTEREQLAVKMLCAWNNVPSGFEWPKDFPEGSREAWMRVADAALISPQAEGL